MYFYNYFDFIIESNIQLTNFEKSDVCYDKTKTTIRINYQCCEPSAYIKNTNDPYLCYEDVIFHIPLKGNTINIISKHEECFQEVIRNKPFSIVCYLMGRTVLHASSIETANGIYAFCGPKGMGKTTISLLLAKVYPLFSDDQLCVGTDTNNNLVCYSPDNIQKVTHSTIEYLKMDANQNFFHPVYNKYMVRSPNFSLNKHGTLKALFILNRDTKHDGVFIKRILDKSHKAAHIINNTLAKKQLLSLGYTNSNILNQLINVDVFYLCYPDFFDKNFDFISEWQKIIDSLPEG